MADKAARNQQYEYKAVSFFSLKKTLNYIFYKCFLVCFNFSLNPLQNSNLVLQADTRLIERRPRDEATGEVVSLSGKITGTKMGDKFVRTKPTGLNEDKDKKKKKIKSEASNITSIKYDFNKYKGVSILSDETNLIDIRYRPKTEETKQIYEKLLGFVLYILGDQPRDVLCGSVDEILEVLKNPNKNDKDKRREVEELFDVKLTDERYSTLYNLVKKISDYKADEKRNLNEDADNTDYGINVQIMESDDEDDNELVTEIREEDDEDDDQLGLEMNKTEEAFVGEKLSKSFASSKRQKELNNLDLDPREIDAFWIQRKLKKVNKDENFAQKAQEQVLKILQSDADDRAIENQLVQALGFDQFDVIKIIRDNRQMVLYCTLLASAQTKKERNRIRDKMNSDSRLSWILKLLEENEDRSSHHLNEDMDLDEEINGNGDDNNGNFIDKMEVEENRISYKLLDLDDLSFSQGSHFMSNSKCQLPSTSYRKERKGYEEVYIPAPKASEEERKNRGDFEIEISSLPKYAQEAFRSIRKLNRVQSKVYKTAMETDENILLSAPTSAGKTMVALTTIMREIGKHIDPNDGTISAHDFKIIYVAPMRSLVQEMVRSFGEKLKSYNITVSELTGDNQLTKEQIDASQIIVCTPEKLDVGLRKGMDRSYTQLIRLIIFGNNF